MSRKQKQSDLDRYLQGHKPMCRMHVYSDDDRRCTCGLDGALREVADMRPLIARLMAEPVQLTLESEA
jgi:hypothetical protein